MANIQSLRPYQQAARDSIHDQWEQGRLRTLLVLPTGTGKTIVFASVAADQVRAGDRVLILAHRESCWNRRQTNSSVPPALSAPWKRQRPPA